MDVNTLIKQSAQRTLWQQFPVRVEALIKTAKSIRKRLETVVKDLPVDTDYGTAYWHPERKEVYFVTGDWWDKDLVQQWENALSGVDGVQEVRYEAETPPPADDGWIKLGSVFTPQTNPTLDKLKPVEPKVRVPAPGQPRPSRPQALEWFGGPHEIAQRMIGGPNPLTSTLVSGALGAGLGWGTQKLLNRVARRYLPEGMLEEDDPAGWSGALIGGGLGAAYPALNAISAVRNQGMQGLVQPTSSGTMSDALQRTYNAWNFFPKQSAYAELAEELYQQYPLDPQFEKAAIGASKNWRGGGGSWGVESVPVDAFNNVVWNDTRPGAARYNPYGSKSPWGNNEQNMFTPTPPPVAGLTSGIVRATGAAYDRKHVSPSMIDTVARSVLGGVGGRLLAGATGAFFNTKPDTQKRLNRIGALGGMLTPIVKSFLR